MYTLLEIEQLFNVFRTMDTPSVLQFVQQMRIPVRAIELFNLDHKKKTTSLLNAKTINLVIVRAILHSSSNIRPVWKKFFVPATLSLAISTFIRTLIYFEEFETYGHGQFIILKLKTQLLKKAFWDNWSAQSRSTSSKGRETLFG